MRTQAVGTSVFQTTIVSEWEVTNGLEGPVRVARWPLVSTLDGRPLRAPELLPVLTVAAGAQLQPSLAQPIDLPQFFGGASPRLSFWVGGLTLEEVEGQPAAKVDVRLLLPALPDLALGKLHVTKSSETFEVELVVLVANENTFALNVERLVGEVLFAGDRFAKFEVAEFTAPPATRHPVPLRINSGIERLNGLSRAALSRTEQISTDVNARVTIEGREIALKAGGLLWPR
ncbi:MAG: hypothetical protein JNK82_29360 [Myxococcaceae bacterium]|nr:hypothetical protein [Myxococcaceae bacterium]